MPENIEDPFSLPINTPPFSESDTSDPFANYVQNSLRSLRESALRRTVTGVATFDGMDIIQNYCQQCRQAVPQDEMRWLQGSGMICDPCYSQLDVCSACGERQVGARIRVEGADHATCSNCANTMLESESHIRCEGCGILVKKSLRPFCDKCVKENKKQRNIWYRRPTFLEKTKLEKGTLLLHDRRIGIELELTAPSQQTACNLSWDTQAFLGVGSDGSIKTEKSSEVPLEIQTPPQAGKLAEDTIKSLCSDLIGSKCLTNITCGYHVHIDVSDIDTLNSTEQLFRAKRLWLAYLAFEDVLLSFLPPSRQENRRYASPLRADYHADEIMRARNMSELEQLWYRLSNPIEITRAKNEHRHASRYRGINLHPFFSGRHIEIRYHSGTLNYRKILEWANLNVRIVEIAMNSLTSLDDLKFIVNEFNLEKKTQILFKLAKLSEQSIGYFRARQQLFMPRIAEIKNSNVDEGMKLLDNEKEI